MTPRESRPPVPTVTVPVSTPLTGTAPLAPPPQRWRTHVILFLLTIVTTTIAGAGNAGVDPINEWWNTYRGIPFSLTLLTILLAVSYTHLRAHETS